MNYSMRQAARRASDAREARYQAQLAALPLAERAAIEVRWRAERARDARLFWMTMVGLLAWMVAVAIAWARLPQTLHPASCHAADGACEARTCMDWRASVVRPACPRHRHLP